MAERRQVLGELGQDAPAALENDDARIVGAQVRIAFEGLADERLYLGRDLYPGVPAARDDEGQYLPPALQVVLHLGPLQDPHQLVPQPQRVAHRLERKGVLRQARKRRQVYAAADGNYEMVVGKVLVGGLVGIGDDDVAAMHVDGVYLGLVEPGEGAQAADGVQNMGGLDAAGHHLGEHRLEQEEVVAAHQGELDLAAPRRLLELQGRVNAPVSPAQNHYAELPSVSVGGGLP